MKIKILHTCYSMGYTFGKTPLLFGLSQCVSKLRPWAGNAVYGCECFEFFEI